MQHNTQKKHLIFYLADKEKALIIKLRKFWRQTKICFDSVFGIFDFYTERFNNYVGDGMKNPLMLEQQKEVKALNSIWKCNKLKHIILTQRNKRSKRLYSPNLHKDISFNQNLVSKFGAAE